MKIIVGLGNPGDQYKKTRHNVGFLFVDFLQKKYNFPEFLEKSKFKALISEKTVKGEKVLLVKPLTYMNLSGETLVALKQFYKFEDEEVLICYDDIDLPFGSFRYRAKGSAGTHNGMKSIVNLMGKNEIPRLRIGIDSEMRKGDLSSFVLGRFTENELNELPDVFENSLANLSVLP